MTARARAYAEPAPRRDVPETPRPPRQRTVPSRRRRVQVRRIGLLWIPAIALLLGGIVWINVVNLKTTTGISQAVSEQQQVQAETSRLRAAIAQRDFAVLEQARRRLDMRQTSDDDLTFIPALPSP